MDAKLSRGSAWNSARRGASWLPRSGNRGRGGRNKVYVTVILKLSPHNGYVPAMGAKSIELTFTLDPAKRQAVDPKLLGYVEGHVGES